MLHDKIHPGRSRISAYGVIAIIIIVLAVFLRISLIAQGWPQTDSDEATMGLMAWHIAYHGELPVFFYGQGYIGSLEAFLGAALFHLLGPSLFSLRLGVVLLFALFLASMYLLTSLLYSKALALVTLVLLSLGSNEMLFRQLTAEGGHPETPLFGTILLLFTTWLALTSRQNAAAHIRKWRIALYGLWGFTVGVAIWNDTLVLPFIVMAGLFLWLCCRDELRKPALLSLLLGLFVALLPTIIYNFTVPIEKSSLAVLGVIVWHGQGGASQGGASPAPTILTGLAGTILVSLPTALGGSTLCGISSSETWPLSAQSSPHTMQCTIVHGAWGVGFIALWSVAFFLTIRGQWKPWQQDTSPQGTRQGHSVAVLRLARLVVLASTGLSLLIFALGAQASLDPLAAARYLVVLLVAVPAVLWPVWNAGSKTMADKSALGSIKRPLQFPTIGGRLDQAAGGSIKRGPRSSGSLRFPTIGKYGVLLLIGITLLLGIIQTFSIVPGVQAHDRQQEMLVRDLLHLGATRIYSDYWTCDLVIFLSQEKIICGVLDEQLQPGFDRYAPYPAIVRSAPQPCYVFPVNSPQATAFASKIAGTGQRYTLTVIDNYDVYRPISVTATTS